MLCIVCTRVTRYVCYIIVQLRRISGSGRAQASAEKYEVKG